jgi:hypothetical protein
MIFEAELKTSFNIQQERDMLIKIQLNESSEFNSYAFNHFSVRVL